MDDDIKLAHKRSIGHLAEIRSSAMCGCFYCLETFPAARIAKWIDNGQTALCPHCGIDSVIGDASGFPITLDFLSAMHRHWF